MLETPYAETEALLAVLNDDDARCITLLEDMLPRELKRFEDRVFHLQQLIGRRRRHLRMQNAIAQRRAIDEYPQVSSRHPSCKHSTTYCTCPEFRASQDRVNGENT